MYYSSLRTTPPPPPVKVSYGGAVVGIVRSDDPEN
jgi:hypothetical protein